MNERIQKLAVEAEVWANQFEEHWADGPDTYQLFKEKFAELILQDIDLIVDELYHAMPAEQASVLLTLDENIKEHFYGVKR
jgi:hypothetical protein